MHMWHGVKSNAMPYTLFVQYSMCKINQIQFMKHNSTFKWRNAEAKNDDWASSDVAQLIINDENVLCFLLIL